MKDLKKSDPNHSVTIYRSPVGLPSLMIIERTSTSGLPWEPVISHRMQSNCEILYVMGGTGRIAIQDKWYDAVENQIFFIPPNIPLDLTSQEVDKIDLLYAHFHMHNDHHFRRITGPNNYILQEIETLDDEAYINMLILPDQIVLPRENPVLFYLNKALDVYESKSFGYYQESCSFLLTALYQLANSFITMISQPITGPKGPTAALARRIRSYITSRIVSFSGMDELGKAFQMNSQHLSRVFKRIYGENIVSFVNHLRIEIAKKQLVGTRKSIPEVAEISGFKTANHFQRVFKNEVGLSPLEFRSHRAVKSTPQIVFTTPLERKE